MPAVAEPPIRADKQVDEEVVGQPEDPQAWKVFPAIEISGSGWANDPGLDGPRHFSALWERQMVETTLALMREVNHIVTVRKGHPDFGERFFGEGGPDAAEGFADNFKIREEDDGNVTVLADLHLRGDLREQFEKGMLPQRSVGPTVASHTRGGTIFGWHLDHIALLPDGAANPWLADIPVDRAVQGGWTPTGFRSNGNEADTDPGKSLMKRVGDAIQEGFKGLKDALIGTKQVDGTEDRMPDLTILKSIKGKLGEAHDELDDYIKELEGMDGEGGDDAPADDGATPEPPRASDDDDDRSAKTPGDSGADRSRSPDVPAIPPEVAKELDELKAKQAAADRARLEAETKGYANDLAAKGCIPADRVDDFVDLAMRSDRDYAEKILGSPEGTHSPPGAGERSLQSGTFGVPSERPTLRELEEDLKRLERDNCEHTPAAEDLRKQIEAERARRAS